MSTPSRLFAFLCLATGLLVGSVSAQAAPIVTNGDFETRDFTGWTLTGDSSFVGVDSSAPQAGGFAAYFGPSTPGGISQTLTTVAGTSYHVQYWIQTEGDVTDNSTATPNSFQFTWGGIVEDSFTNLPATAYTLHSFDLVALGASTTIAFTFTDGPAFIDFDSVSVAAAALTTVPEPDSLALLALAGTALVLSRRRRNRA
jgi:hypothetical protein